MNETNKISVNEDLLEEGNVKNFFSDTPRGLSRREAFIEELKNMLIEDELMANGSQDEIIYSIDDIDVYGGFDYGIRGVDHNNLISDEVGWEDILNWGIVAVPESRTYISDSYEEKFEDIGYERLALNSNHIVGFKSVESDDLDFEINDIPDSVAFGHTTSDEGYDELQAYINFHEETVDFTAGDVIFKTEPIDAYDITEIDMLNIINDNDEETEDLLDNIVGDLYSFHNDYIELSVEEEEVIDIEVNDENMNKIAVGVGYEFNLFEQNEVSHIDLSEENRSVVVDEVSYKLHVGKTFHESSKVDEMLDRLGGLKIDAHTISDEIPDECSFDFDDLDQGGFGFKM